jgi:predicted ATPase
MYLREVRVRNFMIHQDTAVNLLPLTVFVGPNGGGKSAFFDALLNFSMLARGNLREAFGPYPFSFRAALYRGASRLARIGYRIVISEGQSDNEHLVYEVDYAQSSLSEEQPSFTIFSERLLREPGGSILFDRGDPDRYPAFKNLDLEPDRGVFSALRKSQAKGDSLPAMDRLALDCAQQISRFNRFRLDPSVLSNPSRMPDVTVGPNVAPPSTAPRLGYHGEDLAATLYYLTETESPELERIKDKVKEIDSQFSGFEFNNVGTDRVGFSAVYSDARQIVPAVRLSAGMLTYLGLIVLVSTANRPPVLMIEEPENGLTPQAIRSFYKAVKQLAYGDEPALRSQVLISSHSPFVICEAWNGEDRDFIHQVKVVEGKAIIRKFSDVVAEHKIHLAKDSDGKRTHLSLGNAEEIMSGYLS